MAFFGLFGKKKKRDTITVQKETSENLNSDSLNDYTGMRVEVTTFEGQVLFIAQLVNIRGSTAELLQYSDSTLSTDPQEAVNVRIRGYDDRKSTAVYLEGNISSTPERIWKVEELTLLRVGNDRAFFRVDTSIDATVTSLSNTAAGEEPCRLLNISVGGVCIISSSRYHKGEKILLNVKLFEERDASIMFCKVLRVIEKDYLGFEYGCRFLEMNETEQNKLTQIIFDLQHKRIPSQTDTADQEEKKEI